MDIIIHIENFLFIYQILMINDIPKKSEYLGDDMMTNTMLPMTATMDL